MKEIYTLFKGLSSSGKIIVFLLIGWFVTYSIMGVKLHFAHKALVEQIEEEKAIVEKNITANEQKQDSAIAKGYSGNTKIQSDIKYINEKSKQDAEKIYNSDYPISKLDSLLASYD